VFDRKEGLGDVTKAEAVKTSNAKVKNRTAAFVIVGVGMTVQ
jgi:hypothetical protein